MKTSYIALRQYFGVVVRTAVITILSLALCPMNVFGQVSDAQVKADIKKNEPNTISITLENAKNEKVFENGKWVHYFRKMYRSVEKTKWNGVTYHYYGGAQYVKSGNSYRFDKLTVGDGYYKGFSAPDKTELENFILKNGVQFFGHYFNKIIGSQMPKVELVDGQGWKWHSLRSVSGKVKCTFTVPVNNTKLEKAIHVFDLRLYADADKAINKNVAWARMSVSEVKDEKKVISTSSHTADEVRNMPTLATAAEGVNAQQELESLPQIDKLPQFATSLELFYFTHNVLMTKSKNEIRSYLYHLAASNCRSGQQVNQMTDFAQGWIDKLVENAATYKKTHCEFPSIKHQQSNMAELYDKLQRRKIRFSGQQEKGSWYLSGIDYYPAKQSEIEEISKGTKCGSASDYKTEKRKIVVYNIGDAVDVTFSNGVFPCTVQKVDPANRNRYYVVMQSNNSGYWMDEINLKPGKGNVFKFNVGDAVNCEFSNGTYPCTIKAINKAEQKYQVALSNGTTYWVYAQTVSTGSSVQETKTTTRKVKVGDTVFVNSTKGKIKAKVLKIVGTRYEIQYTDPRYSATKQWVKRANFTL